MRIPREAFSPRRLSAYMLSLAFAAGAVACDDDDPTGPDEVAGSYDLVTVNGEPPPTHFASFEEDGITVDVYVAGGMVELNADETFTATTDYAFEVEGEPSGSESATESGTYVIDGNDITFTEETEDRETEGTISGDRITVIVPEANGFPETTFVYER